VKVARKSNLTVELGPILNDLGTAYFGVGRLDESLQVLEESRTLLRDGNNLPLLASNLTNSATYQFLIGENDSASVFIEEAYNINQSIDNTWGLALSQAYLGLMYLINGSWGRALTALKRSIELSEKTNSARMLAASLLGKVSYCVLVGATEKGISLCRRVLKVYGKQMSNFQGYPWGLLSLLHLIDGDRSSAKEALQNSLANINLDLPPIPTLSSIDVRIAEIKFRLEEGRPDLAARRADDLLDYLERFHVRQFRSDALMLKAKALLALDQPREANEILDDACREAEELSTQPILWQILDAQADAMERLEEPDQAASKRGQARAILATLADSLNEDEDRATFLNLPDVRRLLEA
jgi:tetratricopeptide (TPR) repeat protein